MNRTIMMSLVLLLIATISTQAQDKICNVWYTSERESKVEIFLAADGKYYGKLVWMIHPTIDGEHKTDYQNPDPAKRNQPYIGLQIISGLVKKSETEYVNGRIYDPTKGNTYHCKMTLTGNNLLELRGYILGLPFLGRTTTWILAQ